jgi:hypothetical protein
MSHPRKRNEAITLSCDKLEEPTLVFCIFGSVEIITNEKRLVILCVVGDASE